MIGHFLIQAKDIELAGYYSQNHKLQHCTSERSATRLVLSKDLAVESESAAEVRDYLGLQQLSVRCVDTQEGVNYDLRSQNNRCQIGPDRHLCSRWHFLAMPGVVWSYILHFLCPAFGTFALEHKSVCQAAVL